MDNIQYKSRQGITAAVGTGGAISPTQNGSFTWRVGCMAKRLYRHGERDSLLLGAHACDFALSERIPRTLDHVHNRDILGGAHKSTAELSKSRFWPGIEGKFLKSLKENISDSRQPRTKRILGLSSIFAFWSGRTRVLGVNPKDKGSALSEDVVQPPRTHAADRIDPSHEYWAGSRMVLAGS